MILPPIWNVPYRRNPFFTGREDTLTHLHHSLQADQVAALTQPQGISGLGGIGKTQTALEYAYRYHADYRAILWVRADTHTTLVSGFVAIAHLLNLPDKDEQDQNRIVEAVMHWLRSNADWLLIYDNVDDLAIANNFIPAAHRGHMLLTTRAGALSQIAQPVKLEKMLPEVGALLLLRRASVIDPQGSLDAAIDEHRTQAIEISRTVDGLPLAINQAGAYIKEASCSLSDYLSLYQIRRADLLKERRAFDPDYPESITTTWSLSFEKVEQANPAAVELLNLCAFLSSDAIPEEVIIDGASHLGPILRPVAVDSLQLNSAMSELLKFSLLDRESDNQTFTIHRLIQAVLKDRMEENRHSIWAERAVLAVSATFPDVVGFVTWSRCQRCLPHAEVCATLITQLRIASAEASHLLYQAGSYLHDRAQYVRAEHLYRSALDIRERTLEPDHPDIASSLNNLAALYRAQGQYSLSERLYQRALTIREQVLGTDHPDTAATLNNMGMLYRAQGKYNQAEQFWVQALTIKEKILEHDDLSIATGLSNLAGLYAAQGSYARAEPLYERAFAIRKKKLPANHPDITAILNNLATLSMNQGKYVQAEELYQQVIEIDEEILGAEHSDLAIGLNNLGRLYLVWNKCDQAELLLLRAVDICEKALGMEHTLVAICLKNLADVYRLQGKYSQSELLYKRILAIDEQALGTKHVEVANDLHNQGLLYYTQGKYAEAKSLFVRAVTIYQQALGLEHHYVAMSYGNLARLYEAQNDYAQAKSFYQQSLAILKEKLGVEHPTTATVMKNYAAFLQKMDIEKER